MKFQKQYLWLAVTADEYELPLAVEDTAAALARRLGVSENTVRTVEYRGKNERYRKKNEKRTDAGIWSPVQGPESGGKTVERLTTAYERILVDESAGMQYVANASDLEVENRLGTYEDAEEARAKAEQLLRQRNRLKSGWIPVTERLPENDDYVLMSFENFSLPLVGRYVDDEKLGGAWYLGDCLDEDTCLANDLFVNAWMPLPKPYREDE